MTAVADMVMVFPSDTIVPVMLVGIQSVSMSAASMCSFGVQDDSEAAC